jgi:Xaa-Pro aminopeptidase
MKSDLDALMQENDVDALIISGSAMHNPAMVYLTGMVFLTSGVVIKKRTEPAVLFHHPMEREEAAASGLKTISFTKYPYQDLHRQANGDAALILALRYKLMLEELGITQGRVYLYGLLDTGLTFSVFSALAQMLPAVQFTGDLQGTLLPEAMGTKDEQEVERIRRMGKITTQVVSQVADFLSSQRVVDETLVNSAGQPVTIRDVKSSIRLWMAQQGAEDPEGTIFAMGRDAAIPHSVGNPNDPLRLGKTIVFDIFPCEAGGGFFYDFTRTWCLGYATEEAQQLYEQVRGVYRQIVQELKVNAPCSDYQKRTCELFEQMGHPTIMNSPLTETGYVHGLGHGVGLNIHEKPWFFQNSTPENNLKPGTVFTLEPGLYYPERGLGVRLEDTFWMRPDGQAEVLAEFPMDLVLPVQK